MKKGIALGALAVLLLLSLWGCAEEKAPVQPTEIADTTASEVPVTEQTVPVTEPMVDPVTELTCVDGLSITSVSPAGGRLLVFSCYAYADENDKTTFYLVDTQKDEILTSAQFDGFCSMAAECAPMGILYCRCPDGTVYRLNSDLEIESSFVLPEENCYFSADGESCYFVRDMALYGYDIRSGSTELVPVNREIDIAFVYDYDAPSSRLYLEYRISEGSYEWTPAVLNLKTGDVDLFGSEYLTVRTFGDRYFVMCQTGDEESYSYVCGNLDGTGKRSVIPEGSLPFRLEVPGFPYVVMQRDSSIDILDLSGKPAAAYAFDKNSREYVDSIAMMEEENTIVAVLDKGGDQRVVLIHLTALDFEPLEGVSEEENAVPVNTDTLEKWTPEPDYGPVREELAELRKEADALEEEYGVTILLAEQCIGPLQSSGEDIALSDTLYDEAYLISQTLDSLRTVLAQYPEGFFRQFLTGYGNGGIRFMLTGYIQFGVIEAAGLTWPSGPWYESAINIQYANNMHDTLCHELWHSTENRIHSWDYMALGDEEWFKLNPEDFTYCYDFGDYTDRQEYTFAVMMSDWYFYDTYGTVNPCEDRARVFEMATSNGSLLPRVVMESAPMREKLRVLDETMRRYFNTDGWEDCFWLQYAA